MSARKKTLLVGLDAACWEYYEPLLKNGRLPALQRLIDAGTWGRLKSTMPAWTPAAWATVVTGKKPGKHGVYDMMWLRPGTYEFSPTNSRKRLGTPVWNRLNEQGVRVGMVNVPFTYPVDPVDGFVVTGFGTPSGMPGITHPPEVLYWIEDNLGHYEPWLRFSELGEATEEEKNQADVEHQTRQVQIATKLASQYEVDVLVINLMVPDHANHWLPEMEQVERAIIETDVELGRLIESFQPDNVMAISDHGARRVKGDFLLHVWLREHGYCVQKKRPPAERINALNWLLMKWLRGRWGLSSAPEKLVRYVAKKLITRLPQSLSNKFWNAVERDIPFARVYYELSEELDYSRTRVYLGSSRSGLLYLNLVGREPTGVVAPEDRELLVDELADKLKGIVDPETGKPLFSNVFKAEEIYEGGTLKYAPDITLDFYEAPYNILATFRRGALMEKLSNKYFVGNFGEYGHHGPDGLFVFAGLDFNEGPANQVGDLADIPSTLLHLYDVPIPEDYDGRVMVETLAPAFTRQHAVRYQPGDDERTFSFEDDAYSAEETEELVAQLKALGYLD